MKRANGGHGWSSSWTISNPERWCCGWCCESVALNMPTNLENPGMATGLKSVSFHSNPKEKQCQRMVILWTIALISYASKVMFKILQARLQQYVNRELPDVQAGFVKADEPEIKLPTYTGSLKKHEHSRKTSTSASLIMPKPLTVWIATNSGKSLKSWEYQTTWPDSWEICMQVKKQQLEHGHGTTDRY